MEIKVVPEPKYLKFSGRWFKLDGIANFPEFIAREFNIPLRGTWEIKKIKNKGTGLRIKQGVIEIWGDVNVCLATIIQLLRHKEGYLPEVEIHEEFIFKFRGFHLDIARGGVPNVKTFKEILRWLFLLKYNYFAIYFEDLFPWKKYPQIGAKRGRLSEDELREIIEYGKKLGIEVFPSLELCGHMENILTLPEFRRFSEWHRPSEGCLDLSNPEARQFAYELLEEVVEFFPSKYIHIGGDETWALGRGKSLNKTWKFEGPKLYLEHHAELIKIVKRYGKIPMMWGDMISGMYLTEEEKSVWKEVLEENIWKEAIIANWDYSPSSVEHFINKIKIFSEKGYIQVACPGFNNWNRYYPDFSTALTNIRNFLSAARKEKILGFLVTAWGDDGEECLFSFLYPLLLATMEYAEGKGEWESKWCVIAKESNEILEIRKSFGKSEIANNIKRALYAPRKELEKIISYEVWDSVLRKCENTNLPEDLLFIKNCIKLGLSKIRGKATVSEYIKLAEDYANLWLKERKKEGLDRIIRRFWGAAGSLELERRIDYN